MLLQKTSAMCWGFLLGERMISVIVPYRDAERWIQRCADSLRTQQGDFEFIFVNDHSTDNGYEVLFEATKDDKRFIRITEASPDGRGVSWARNTGLMAAQGEWVTFLDADDELLPDAWDKFSRVMGTEADICQFNHVRHYVVNPAFNVNRNKYDNQPGMYDVKNLPQVWFGVWNKLYRASLLDDIRFDETMQYGEDLIFNLECLAKSGQIYHAGSTTVKHNVENMESLSHIRTDVDLIKELKALEDFIVRHKDRRLKKLAYSLVEERLNRRWYRNVICG